MDTKVGTEVIPSLHKFGAQSRQLLETRSTTTNKLKQNQHRVRTKHTTTTHYHTYSHQSRRKKNALTNSKSITSRSLDILSNDEPPMTAAKRNRKYSNTQKGSSPLNSCRNVRRSKSFSQSTTRRRVTKGMVGCAMLANARPRRRFSPHSQHTDPHETPHRPEQRQRS